MSDLNLDGLTDAQKRLFAVRCARRVQHLMTDPRSLAAMNVAERYAKGEATDAELEEARDAAENAARAMEWGAGRDAAWAAERSAECDATDAALESANEAWDAAWKAERAERAEQQKILDEVRNMK